MNILTYSKITKTGIPVTYWVLSQYGVFTSRYRHFEITLKGYMSKKVYETEGSEPLDMIILSSTEQEYIDYFSEEALKEAAKEGKTIYDKIYEYVVFKDPELKDVSTSVNPLKSI